MKINTLDDKGKTLYLKKMFTENGYNTLKKYVDNLAQMYIQETEYPFSIGIVFGIPCFKSLKDFLKSLIAVIQGKKC